MANGWKGNSCWKCGGDVYIDRDEPEEGSTLRCVQCGAPQDAAYQRQAAGRKVGKETR